MIVQLTRDEAEALGERVEALLDTTEDWQLEEQEFIFAVRFWLKILRELDQIEKEEKWRKLLLEKNND